jgi:AbrB family looped-hinge helix DNA binding protein
MAIAKSQLTSQCKTTVPAEVRKRLGLGAGSVLEWDQEDDKIVVRKSKGQSSRLKTAQSFRSST